MRAFLDYALFVISVVFLLVELMLVAARGLSQHDLGLI